MKYTNDEGKIFPYIKDYVCNGYHVDYEKIGQYKRAIWSFQKEWRYILYIHPVKLSDFLISFQNDKRVYKENILLGADLEISKWFLKLEEEA